MQMLSALRVPMFRALSACACFSTCVPRLATPGNYVYTKSVSRTYNVHGDVPVGYEEVYESDSRSGCETRAVTKFIGNDALRSTQTRSLGTGEIKTMTQRGNVNIDSRAENYFHPTKQIPSAAKPEKTEVNVPSQEEKQAAPEATEQKQQETQQKTSTEKKPEANAPPTPRTSQTTRAVPRCYPCSRHQLRRAAPTRGFSSLFDTFFEPFPLWPFVIDMDLADPFRFSIPEFGEIEPLQLSAEEEMGTNCSEEEKAEFEKRWKKQADETQLPVKNNAETKQIESEKKEAPASN